MYSKTRNTLTALIAATLFMASGWMLGRPLDATALPSGNLLAQPSHDDDAGASMGVTILRGHHDLRLSLSMPYYSFSLMKSDRRAD
ncbi:MAG: hypothetical protein JSS45_11005 [Proteobacteria bacterium]|nr:hypothetical protein [Pseudomonadota bacterium]